MHYVPERLHYKFTRIKSTFDCSHNMKSIFTRLFSFLLLFTGFLKTNAQSILYSTTHYTTDNGLPQNSVKDIKFDKAGYCWLSTEMGLVRFDGKNFKTYGANEINGLASVRIQRLAKNLGGDLFAQADGGQVISVSAANRFISPAPKLTDAKVLRITPTHSGHAVTDTSIVNSIDSIARLVPPTYTMFLYGLNAGQVYIRVQDTLFYLHKSRMEGRSFQQIKVSSHRLASASDIIIPIGSKHLLFFLPGGKVNIWKNGVPSNNYTSIDGDLAHDENYLNFTFEDYEKWKFQLFWCENGTYLHCGKSIYELTFAQGKVTSRKMLGNIDIPGLASIYYNPSQNRFYLGSVINGLYVVQFNSFQYPPIPAEVARLNFYSQARVDENSVFSNDALVPTHGKPSYIPLESNGMVAFYSNNHKELYYERNFHLNKFNFKTHQDAELLSLSSRLRTVFPEPSDTSIFFTTEDSIGVLSRDKLLLYKKYPGKLKIVNVMRLEKDRFLLATQKGVKYYRFRDNKIQQSFLDSLHIRALHQDTNGSLWISSYGRGFYLKQGDRIYKLPYGPKQALKTVHAFIEDKKGNFWLPTNDGLYVVKKADLTDYAHGKIPDVYFHMFNRLNGLRTNEFNGGCDPSYVWLKDSLLSLPSMEGLVWLYPNRLNIEYPSNKIYIDYLSINGRQAKLSDNHIVLPAKYGIMSIGVSCPYFGNIENIQLEYLVKGINTQWLPVPANGEFTLSALAHGSYKVILRKQGTHQSSDQLEILIRIEPMFYNTWWFYLLIILLAALMIYLFTRQRLNALEELVSARTRELSEVIDELGQSEQALLRSNLVKDKVVTMVLHDMRSPIRYISHISSILIKNRNLLSEQEFDNTLCELDSGARGLQAFTEQFFIWATTQQVDFIIKKEEFLLDDLFRDLFELYQDIARLNGNKLLVNNTDLTVRTDYQILAFIVRNLIDNGNKNTKNGTIILDGHSTFEHTFITVSDTGRGMSEMQIEKFLDENRSLKSEGTGSVLILQMLCKINGKLEIRSTSELGSTFIVCIENLP